MATELVAEMVSAAAVAAAELGLVLAGANLGNLRSAEIVTIEPIVGSAVSGTMLTPHLNYRLAVAPRTLTIFDSLSPFAE